MKKANIECFYSYAKSRSKMMMVMLMMMLIGMSEKKGSKGGLSGKRRQKGRMLGSEHDESTLYKYMLYITHMHICIMYMHKMCIYMYIYL
jgi:hypothetical protein